MGEWGVLLHRSKGNRLHKRFCRLLIIMALVGGALIGIGDNSAPDECEEGGPLISIGNFFYWTSFLSIAINGLILFVSIFTREMSAGEVYLQTFFHIIVLVVVLAIFGQAINCHFPIVVAPSYNIGAGF
jgi:hypothetical protein